MKKPEFIEFKKNLNIKEFSEYTYYHSEKEIVEKYGISYGNLRELRKEFNIHTPLSISNERKKKTWKNKSKEVDELLMVKVSKQDILDYYEIQNHTWGESMSYFGLTNSEFARLLRLYNIHKSNEAHVAKIKESKLANHGDPNYNNRKKCIDTCLEKYGVTNVSQLEWVQEAMKVTWLEHGYTHPMHVDSIKQKVIDSGKLYNNDSKPNKLFASLLEDNNISYSKEFVLNNFRYDFKIDTILVEINPTAFHNCTWNPFGDPIKYDYHRNKSLNAVNEGYRCIHVWDWDSYESIISLILPREKIYARNCAVKEVSKDEAKKFINTYHLQKYTQDKIRLGLYHNDELVSIMTFGKPRYNSKFQWELIRFCSSKQVIGGSNKLFTNFIRGYSPKSIISYCDFSKFSGYTYEKLGFKKHKEIPDVGIHWYKNGHHVLNNVLRQQGADRIFHTDYGKWTSNIEIALEQGYSKVCDAGQFRFEWFKEK